MQLNIELTNSTVQYRTGTLYGITFLGKCCRGTRRSMLVCRINEPAFAKIKIFNDMNCGYDLVNSDKAMTF